MVELLNETVDVDSGEDSVVESETVLMVVVGVSEVADETVLVAQGSVRSSTLNVKAVQPSTTVGPCRTSPVSDSQI